MGLLKKFSHKLGRFFRQLWEQTWLSEIIGFVSVGVVATVDFLRKFHIKK